MKIRIKRIDKSLPLPTYSTVGSVCFDLMSRQTMLIKAKEIALIPTNLIIEVPKGYMLLIASRSGTPKKKGLVVPHGIGIIDQDYHGPNDEVMFQVYNPTDIDINIFKGERLAQGCILPTNRVEFEEVENDLGSEDRGGFGSTGK